MSDADLLRRAAKTLRLKANAATAGPWRAALATSPRSSGTSAIYAYNPRREVVGSTPKLGGIWKPSDADYIATMHPGVALALADWLETVADVGTCE
jgi:hypothetical protein